MYVVPPPPVLYYIEYIPTYEVIQPTVRYETCVTYIYLLVLFQIYDMTLIGIKKVPNLT